MVRVGLSQFQATLEKEEAGVGRCFVKGVVGANITREAGGMLGGCVRDAFAGGHRVLKKKVCGPC